MFSKMRKMISPKKKTKTNDISYLKNLNNIDNKQLFLTSGPSNESFPVSEDLYLKGMYVPSGSNLDSDDILYIAKKIEDSFLKLKKGRKHVKAK